MDKVDQDGFSNQHDDPDLLDSQQAAQLLGVKAATLYAYVSRGLLSSAPASAGRGNRYARSDLMRLKQRAEARSGHGPVAAAALDFGEPVLESALTAIDAQGPRYRGRSSVALAASGVAFESVAEFLWSGEESALSDPPPRFSAAPELSPAALLKLIPMGTAPTTALSLLLPVLGLQDATRFAAPPEVEKAIARRLIMHLASGLALGDKDAARFREALGQKSVAQAVAVALGAVGAQRKEVLSAINQALVLMADHELNMSTFAARVAASAGADLYACLTAALCTVSGPRHGGACDRVEALVAEAQRTQNPELVVRERLRRGELVPGFGHPLYLGPQGDPRTAPLLATAQALGGRHAGLRTLLAIIDAMRESGHPPPTVDTGLLALALALKLPPGSATALFAVGRTAGWVAHVLEQRQSPVGLRPRARYRGPA